jgi:hypothetical protein
VVRSFKVFYSYQPLPYNSCIFWYWLWWWSHMSQICYRFLYLSRWFSYFLEDYFLIFNWSRISSYDIYYKRDCLFTLVTCWYESFSFSSYSYACIVTTRVLFRMLTTQFFMNELSTLRSIVIFLVIILSMTPLLSFLFFLFCRLQISLPSHIIFLVFIF